jgi:hypothetical protein
MHRFPVRFRFSLAPHSVGYGLGVRTGIFLRYRVRIRICRPGASGISSSWYIAVEDGIDFSSFVLWHCQDLNACDHPMLLKHGALGEQKHGHERVAVVRPFEVGARGKAELLVLNKPNGWFSWPVLFLK